MSTTYNRIAGQSVERLAALSDGIFAVAMTLLVLDLRAPAVEAIHSEHDLWRALTALAPRLVMYMMSFMTLSIFWIGQQTQLNHLAHSHRSLSWIHILFLFAVTVTPFSTMLLAEFTAYRIALLTYWANIVLLGTSLYLIWVCALDLRLVKDDMPPGVSAAIKQRILIGQGLYAAGALLCLINPYWSIGFIVLVQLYFAIAPRLPGRPRSYECNPASAACILTRQNVSPTYGSNRPAREISVPPSNASGGIVPAFGRATAVCRHYLLHRRQSGQCAGHSARQAG
jgi:uncharacterized membrane protein